MNFTHGLFTSSNLVSNGTFYISESVSSYIQFVVYSINVILGLPINSYVLWLICTEKRSGIVAEFFSLNLALCQIIFCLISLVFIFVDHCTAIIYITFFSSSLPTAGCPLINCVICIERYLAVLHPVSFLKYKSLKYRLACSAVIWLLVLGFGVLYIFLLYFNITSMFIRLYLPLLSVLLSINLFCCLTIVRALKHPGPGEKGKERKEANNMKKKAITLILIITLTMFVQYTPMIFIGLLYSTLSEADMFLSIGVSIFLLFGHINPILYICRVRNLTLSDFLNCCYFF